MVISQRSEPENNWIADQQINKAETRQGGNG